MGILYYWSKFIKKLPGSSIKNTRIEQPAKIEARSTVIDSSIGRYSYCGYNCTILNAQIGRFCSISDSVIIGQAQHPLEWVSTSPAFYRGRDSIPKDLAQLDFDTNPQQTVIGNDVWIGQNAILKSGITVGDGAVIAMGSIVTKDVEPYAIVGGNPAHVIKMRFDDRTIERLLQSEWWNMDMSFIKKNSNHMKNVQEFLGILEESER